MSMFRRTASFFRNLFGRDRVDAKLDEELRTYVDLLAAEHRRAGVGAPEAQRLALLAVGGVEQVKEQVRDVRAGAWLDSVRQDVRVALRGLGRAPVFTLTTVSTLALGIGATLTVLAVVNAVLVHPLPYPASDRLVTVLHYGTDPVSPPNFLDWRSSLSHVARLEAAEYWSPTFTDGDPEQVVALRVTPGLIDVLGVQPMLGRGFSTRDMLAPTREIVIGYGLWKRRFAGDSSVIGRVIHIDAQAFTIVGVMGPRFVFAPFWATNAELWSPLPLDGRLVDRRASSLRVFGRLAAGVSVAHAQREIDAITGRLDAQFPRTNEHVIITPLADQAIGTARPALLALLGAVAFVLLVTCVNVTHMLLARASARQREVALRIVLGATRRRVIRQALTETALLAIPGAALGLVLAAGALRLVAVRAPVDLPQLQWLGVHAGTWIAACASAVVVTLVIGALPTMLAREAARDAALRDSSRGSTASRGRVRLRQLLIGSQIAFAVVLLTGTGLMVRTFAALRGIDPGFEANGVITMQVPLPPAESSPALRISYFQSIIERTRAVPGVRGAALINHLPLAGDEWGVPTFGGTTLDAKPSDDLRTVYRVVTPGYFDAMHIALVRGRNVEPSDDLDHAGVVIINERLARKLWPGQDAIGQHLTFAEPGGPRPMQTVLGVARDTKQSQWTAAASPEIYRPYAQAKQYLVDPGHEASYMTLVARTGGAPATVVAAVRRVVRDADPTLPVTHVETMTAVVDQMTVRARFLMLVLVCFAAIAIVLAAIGLSGVMSYSVSQRRREIGIRMALGATSMSVTRSVLDQAMVMALAGLAAGIVLAAITTRVIATQLYGVRSNDPVSFLASVLILGGVAAAASVIPVFRALTIDPREAMQSE